MPKIFFGKVMHARLFPKKNRFTYSIYYLCLPLVQLKKLPIAYNCFAPLSFHSKDHGSDTSDDLQGWAQAILTDRGITEKLDITLVCMPRVLGYVFNPVSFWLCKNAQNQLKVVLCEVRNTFGEKHTYICAHDDFSEIQSNEILTGEKLFHVSPFLKREGSYTFRFSLKEQKFGVWIDFYNAENKKQLVTSLAGSLQEMNKKTLRTAFWKYPLVTVKAIILIHWQALKLVVKRVKYIPKPDQYEVHISRTQSSKQD